jgi:hypothetical protein
MSRLSNWFEVQSPRKQWAAGCAGIVGVVALCLYGLGLVSYMVRPTLVATPPAATVVFVISTLQPRPTFSPPTIPPTFALPGSTLPATPTQAPIPTRAPPTETPTLVLGPDGSPIPFTATPDATVFFQLAQTPQP